MAEPGMIDSARVMSRGFRVFGENFVPFIGVALLLIGLPSAAAQYLAASSALRGEAGGMDSLLYLGTLLVSWLFGSLLQAILVRATVLDLADAELDLGQCVVTALGLILPIFAISFLVFMGSAIGSILLIVPGAIFYIAMIASIPALIEERAGVFGSMKRSYRLTRGSWLQIFVLLVLFLIFSLFVWSIFSLAFGVTLFVPGSDQPVMAASAAALGSTITAVVASTMIASLYIELRSVREGATTNDLASIFA
jgi:hypothetical protein